MMNRGRVLLGSVGFFLLACAGTKLTEVGELNEGGSGSIAQGGSDDGVDSVAQGGSDDEVGTMPSAGSASAPQAGAAPALGGTGGSGGSGILSPDPDPTEGGTGGAGYDTPDGEGSVFEQAASRVTAVTADETTLYWVEYGTKDSLGNYRSDGRLMARDFDSTEVRILSDGLPGAAGLGLTSQHAYISVDRFFDGGERNALMRVALTGGVAQTVLVRTTSHWDGSMVCSDCFVHDDDTGYFLVDDQVYRITPEATEAAPFGTLAGYRLAAGEDRLYLLGNDGGVWTVAYDTGAATNLTTEGRDGLQVSGDYVYGIEQKAGSVYLSRMPIAGGNWVRVAARRSGYAWRLQISDGLFFQDVHSETSWKVVQGNLSEPGGAAVALELPRENPHRVWVGTHVGVFWNDGKRVLHTPLVVD